jgi:hypothetical protein
LSALQYYVYYKFDPARIEEVRAIVQQTFDEVRNATGVQGQWQQRRDDASTFMEIYLDVADAGQFDRALAQALEKSGFTRLGIQRITEIFRCA